MFTITQISLIIIAYLLGSINCSIIICKLMKLPSPRSIGSGNPGSTNVLRLGNKKAAIMTLLGDALKGVIPVIIAHIFNFPPLIIAIVALAAVIGHIFPIFFKFRGGKGVATALGVLIAFSPLVGLLSCLTWLIIAILFKYSSLASLLAVACAPIYAYFLINSAVIWPLIVIAILVIVRHTANIKRLCNGTESKIGQKK